MPAYAADDPRHPIMRARRIWKASRRVLDPPDQVVPVSILDQAIALGTRAGTRQSWNDYRDRMEILGLIEYVTEAPKKGKKGEKKLRGVRFTSSDRIARLAQEVA